MASTTFTASGTYTPETAKVLVSAWGGGGSGETALVNGGGGGGGGAYARINLHTVTIGVGITVTVGGTGGDSVFRNTSTLVAKGGSNGSAGTGTGQGGGGPGGPSGTSVGDVKFSGGAGGGGGGLLANGGGGGGAAGTTAVGSPGNSGGPAGAGGSQFGGAGGTGGALLNPGNPGSIPGGGGGGASTLAGPGTGARGEVRITEIMEINVSDSVTLTESHKEQLIHLVNKSESVTVSESYKVELIHLVNKVEYVSLEENVGSNLVDGTFEDGTVEGWSGAGTNCTVANTGNQFQGGTKSLQVTSVASGAFQPYSAAVVVTEGRSYTASEWFRTAVTARAVVVRIAWYSDAAGTVGISVSDSGLYADNASGWVKGTVTAVAPPTAIRARVTASYGNSAASEVHYIDNVFLALTNSPTNPFVTLVYNINGVSDGVTITEDKAFTLVLNAAVSDSVTVTDTLISILLIHFINKSESITITEFLKFTLVLNVTVFENLNSSTPTPTPAQYILLDNGILCVLVADISPYPLYNRL